MFLILNSVFFDFSGYDTTKLNRKHQIIIIVKKELRKAINETNYKHETIYS